MSLVKGIKYHKEHRKPYYGIPARNKAARNHGSDFYFTQNRLFNSVKKLSGMKAEGKANGFNIH